MQVNHIPRVMKHALECTELEDDYQDCWAGLSSHFTETDDKGAAHAKQTNGNHRKT